MTWRFYFGTICIIIAAILALLEIYSYAPIVYAIWGASMMISDSIEEMKR